MKRVPLTRIVAKPARRFKNEFPSVGNRSSLLQECRRILRPSLKLRLPMPYALRNRHREKDRRIPRASGAWLRRSHWKLQTSRCIRGTFKPCCHGFTPYVLHSARIILNSSRGTLKRMSTSMARLNASIVLPIF